MFEGCASRGDGGVDVMSGSCVYGGYLAFVSRTFSIYIYEKELFCSKRGLRRVDTCDLFSRARFDKFIVDEQADWLFIFSAIGSFEIDEEDRHLCQLSFYCCAVAVSKMMVRVWSRSGVSRSQDRLPRGGVEGSV